MRTDDPLDLSEYYAKRGRVLQELGALRDFARLRNRREWQWRRLWLDKTTTHSRFRTLSLKFSYHLDDYLRERRYAWQR